MENILTKVCRVCNDTYPANLGFFYKDSKNKDNLYTECKHCCRARQKQNSERNRNSKLRSAFGITLKDYEDMHDQQRGCCDICGIHQSELKQRLSVDHNHVTGKVRGLLCHTCNVGIGCLKVDNQSDSLLLAAICYIKK